MKKKIKIQNSFSEWPSYSNEEIDAVCNVLKSNKVNYWTGIQCREFEKEFSEWVDIKYSIALNNGTIALELAMKALDISIPQDLNASKPEIIVTSRTFIASASSIVNIGALPIFVDVDINSQNFTIDNIKSAITENTVGILCVHIAGWPCEMDKICNLASENGLYVIEDCAQSHGAKYNEQMVGTFGDISAWSFCQDKIMSTGGEGGMITTNNENLWRRAWSLKDHGKNYSKVHDNSSDNKFKWVHDSFGTNGRMTEMQAAIGRIQIRKMPEWHKARKNNANKIIKFCEKFSKSLRIIEVPPNIDHAWYKLYLFVRPNKLKSNWSRDKIIDSINQFGVPCFSGTCSEVYLEKAFELNFLQPETNLPVARELGETSIMFLVHPTLTQKEIELTCSAIEKVMNLATK